MAKTCVVFLRQTTLCSLSTSTHAFSPPLQIPIKAGHEFIVSTEDKYAESGDDKVLYVDYVSYRDRVVLIRH